MYDPAGRCLASCVGLYLIASGFLLFNRALRIYGEFDQGRDRSGFSVVGLFSSSAWHRLDVILLRARAACD